jgi:hypothetical protein
MSISLLSQSVLGVLQPWGVKYNMSLSHEVVQAILIQVQSKDIHYVPVEFWEQRLDS